FLHDSWISSASAQIDIPYVGTDVTTNASNSLLLCFGPPTLGIRRARLALFADALEVMCSTCRLELSRASIITPKYCIDGCDSISSSSTFNLMISIFSC
ncbi:hypothetical protein HHI36_011776, partial [Cryptolaemus montrouzieri]